MRLVFLDPKTLVMSAFHSVLIPALFSRKMAGRPKDLARNKDTFASSSLGLDIHRGFSAHPDKLAEAKVSHINTRA